MKRLLRSPDPDDGNAPAAKPAEPQQTQPAKPPRNPAKPSGPPPPAAATVATGKVTEEASRLRDDLGKANATLKDRETRISELEDENHQLKAVTPPPARPAKGGPLTVWDW